MAKTMEEIINSLFGDAETMTKAEMTAAISSSGMKLADLSDGDFVTKGKYDDHVAKMKKLQSDFDALKANPSESEQYKAVASERDEWKAKATELEAFQTKTERLASLTKAKVKPEFQNFLLSEIGAKVSETVDFDTAAKKYLAENAQYLEVQDDRGSSLRLGGSPAKDGDGLFSDIDDMIRRSI